MGLSAPLADLLIAKHRHRPIRGRVLFIGRQTTYLNEGSLDHLLTKHRLAPPAGFVPEFDNETCAALALNARVITDRCFMRALGVERVEFLDVSGYEGAEIIADLTQPLDPSLVGRFDFVFNGSFLDNIWNPAAALQNMAALLAPCGRLLSVENGSAFQWALHDVFRTVVRRLFRR